MVELSIELPEDLAAPSLEVALGLGVFRSELIRQALGHEIAQARGVVERRAMAEGLRAMAGDPGSLRFANGLDSALGEPWPKERKGWWKG